MTSSLASFLSVSLCVAVIYFYLGFQTDLIDNFPITHCTYSLSNVSNTIGCNLTQKYSNRFDFKVCLYICDENNCSSVERLCSFMEQSTDLFFKTVGPILFGFLFLSFLSSLFLQFLGNYHNIYNLTKKIPFFKPIIHPSMMVDILDWKLCDQRAKTLIKEASVDIINFSDPITGYIFCQFKAFFTTIFSKKTLTQ